MQDKMPWELSGDNRAPFAILQGSKAVAIVIYPWCKSMFGVTQDFLAGRIIRTLGEEPNELGHLEDHPDRLVMFFAPDIKLPEAFAPFIVTGNENCVQREQPMETKRPGGYITDTGRWLVLDESEWTGNCWKHRCGATILTGGTLGDVAYCPRCEEKPVPLPPSYLYLN